MESLGMRIRQKDGVLIYSLVSHIMMELPPSSSKSDRWLEVVKQNSWEMELLLTGFVLIGLVNLPDIMERFYQQLVLSIDTPSNLINNFVGIPYIALDAGVQIITMNLMLLLLLRGFWIGIVGLSSVYPAGIQPARLNFSKRFKHALAARRFDSDSLVVRLDHLCSSIFALSFLFLFISISAGLFFLQVIIPESLFIIFTGRESEGLNVLRSMFVGLSLFYLLLGFLKAIDFVTVGLFKSIKWRWFARPYFYFSQFVSYATLGFLYRPIYYAFATNMSKSRLRWVLLGYLALVVVLIFDISYSSDHLYYPDRFRAEYEITYSDYQDLYPENQLAITNPIIQSDVIQDQHIRLYIPYLVTDNSQLKAHCPDLVSIQESGFSGRVNFGRNDQNQFTAEDVKRALDCLSSYYVISIDDSVYQNLTFRFYKQPDNRGRGILTYIPISHLHNGFHTLSLEQAIDPRPNLIQFWKEGKDASTSAH